MYSICNFYRIVNFRLHHLIDNLNRYIFIRPLESIFALTFYGKFSENLFIVIIMHNRPPYHVCYARTSHRFSLAMRAEYKLNTVVVFLSFIQYTHYMCRDRWRIEVFLRQSKITITLHRNVVGVRVLRM